MKKFLLEDIDDEDAGDLIPALEISFDIKFEEGDLDNVNTIRDIYDAILKKYSSINNNSCTSQKAFYLLRRELKSLEIYKGNLTPDTLTNQVFKRGRIKSVTNIETKSGLKLNILRPPYFVTTINFILLFIGLINWIFFDTIEGIGFTTFSILSFWMAFKLGTVLKYKSIRELVNHITSTNYSNIRKDKSINSNELEEILIDLFNDFGLTERPTLDSKFGWAKK